MKKLLLQTEMPQGIIGVLMNYGVLGLFAALMIGVIYYMSKQFVSLNKKNETRIIFFKFWF